MQGEMHNNVEKNVDWKVHGDLNMLVEIYRLTCATKSDVEVEGSSAKIVQCHGGMSHFFMPSHAPAHGAAVPSLT